MNKHLPEFRSGMAWLLKTFLSEKRGFGYVYKPEAFSLAHLDRMWRKVSKGQVAMNREWAEQFMAKRPTETTTRGACRRASIWRELARFARRHGLADAYIPDAYTCPIHADPYTPFIYTREQLAALFVAADAIKPWWLSTPRRPWMLGLLLRLLYGAGLRLGEALALRCRDFDPSQASLTLHGKNRRERIIPIAPSLAERLREYLRRFPDTPDAPIFPSPKRPAPLSDYAMRDSFNQILKDAHLPLRENRQGPRLHDLRHTFAVHRLENWIRAGEDVNAKIHLLSVYMGHKNLFATYYYLRITSQLFPDITRRFAETAGHAIPGEGNP